MFIRFVVHRRDEDSGRRQGVFQVLFDMRRAGQLTAAEEATLKGLFKWFDDHLPEPGRLSRSRNPRAKRVAISWFKESATEHVRRMRELVAILDAHSVSVEVVRTDRPGYVVYEDDYQIAAEPFRDTRT